MLAERADICESCGHRRELCRDPKTAGRWQVVQEICQASRVAQAMAENAAEGGKARGVQFLTRLGG